VIADLTDDEQRAWRGLLAVVLVGMPQVERTFREHGLVHIEYGLLVGLAGSAGGRRLTDLAGVMNMSASRLSHRLAKLVERGYVRLRPSGEDGRVTIAEITPAGRALIDRIAPEHLRGLRRVIFDHLDAAQTAALAEALELIGDRLGACVVDHPGPRPPTEAVATRE
jgi:DNA-binding MarR family transcriptional regulator